MCHFVPVFQELAQTGTLAFSALETHFLAISSFEMKTSAQNPSEKCLLGPATVVRHENTLLQRLLRHLSRFSRAFLTPRQVRRCFKFYFQYSDSHCCICIVENHSFPAHHRRLSLTMEEEGTVNPQEGFPVLIIFFESQIAFSSFFILVNKHDFLSHNSSFSGKLKPLKYPVGVCDDRLF